MQLDVGEHALLRASAFETVFPGPLGRVDATPAFAFLAADGAAPLQRDESVRQAVRDMLRAGGYKPTGRGKPASEYLVRAAEEGGLASINAAVDACNAVSLHSGLPISVVDAGSLTPPLRIAVAGPGDAYVFNPAGHEIQLAGLLCLFDGAGPCANAVKDSQRTKTGPDTVRTLSVVWGVAGHEARLDATVAWYRALLESMGASTEAVQVT